MAMPASFVELLDSIKQVFPLSRYEILQESEIAKIRNKYPGVPEHYLDFLRYIGFGRLGEMNFMLFSGPVEPDEIFDKETASNLEGLLFIGDDFAGWELGFNLLDGWRLIGVDSALPKAHALETQTVSDFINQRIEAELIR